MPSADIGVWIAAILVLMVFSFAFKDSPLYRIAEATGVGAMTGYTLWMAIENFNRYIVIPTTRLGIYDRGIAAIIGLFYLFHVLPPKYAWVSRYPIAIAAGLAIGAGLVPAVATYFLKPLTSTIVPFWTGSLITNLNNLIIFVLVFTGLAFFIFSSETFVRGRLGIVSKIGRTGLMVAFGTACGTLLGAKIAPLIDQINFLIHTWLGI